MRKIIPILMMALGLMAACSTLDCPLNNTVYTKYRLAGNITTLTDTLTISTNRIEGTDSVLINKDVNVDSFILPMSYSLLEDSLFLCLSASYRSLPESFGLSESSSALRP